MPAQKVKSGRSVKDSASPDAGKVVRVPSDVYAELITRQLAALKATGNRPTLGDVLRVALGLRA